jgi:hypothetical protein
MNEADGKPGIEFIVIVIPALVIIITWIILTFKE